MKASTKRVVSILLSILLMVGTLVVFTYFIRPSYREIEDQRAEIEARLKLVTEYEAALGLVQRLLKEYQNILKFQEMISLVLPVEQNLPGAVNQVTGLANLNKLMVDLFSVERLAIKPASEPDLAKGLGTLRLNVRLIGDYENFRSFLQNLETNVNLMDLVSLKIEPSARPKLGQNKFSYTMSIDTYYQAE